MDNNRLRLRSKFERFQQIRSAAILAACLAGVRARAPALLQTVPLPGRKRFFIHPSAFSNHPSSLKRLLDHFRSDLAVDLGTVNTLVGIPGEGIVVEEPTVVAVEKASGRVLSGGGAVGLMAKQMEGRTPESIRVVRPLRDGVITDFRLCEALLRHFLRKARRPGWRLRPRVLVGVPGGITPVEKRAVFNSLLRSGAGKVWILPEAMAAAVARIAHRRADRQHDLRHRRRNHGNRRHQPRRNRRRRVDSRGRRRLRQGRRRLSQAAFQPPHQPAHRRAAADRDRQRVSARGEKDGEASGLDSVTGLPRKATVTSEEIRQAMLEPLEKIIEALRDTLDHLTPDLAADLVRGGTRALRRRGARAAAGPLSPRAYRPAGPFDRRAAHDRRRGPHDLSRTVRPLAATAGIERRRRVRRPTAKAYPPFRGYRDANANGKGCS